MPDEFNSWERAQQATPDTERMPFVARGSSVKQAGTGQRVNPYRQEEERDRMIFRWFIGAIAVVLAILGLVFWNVWFSS